MCRLTSIRLGPAARSSTRGARGWFSARCIAALTKSSPGSPWTSWNAQTASSVLVAKLPSMEPG